ncbi:hypothetical protein HZA45_02230 [Candidatus Peregrinibacteria bacterium]|nr:hypothetical protein [Candidatus Peregrinibacteria bacterium]
MKKNPTSKARGITLRDVIAHIQAMRNDLSGRMDRLEIRMDRLEVQMVSLTKEVRMTQMQAGNLDGRLDDIEINHLPKIERKVFGRLIAGRK